LGPARDSSASEDRVSFALLLLLAGVGAISNGEVDQANMNKCNLQCQVVDSSPDITSLARTSQGRHQSSSDSTNACTAISYLISLFVIKKSRRPSKAEIDNIILHSAPLHAAAMRQRSRLPKFAMIEYDAAKGYFQGIAEFALDPSHFGSTVIGNILDDAHFDKMINLVEVEADCVAIRKSSCLSCS
jgi:hypothetical protein